MQRLADVTSRELASLQSLDYVRFLALLHEQDGGVHLAVRAFAERFPRSFALYEKAAVPAGTTFDPAWAGPLVVSTLARGFVEYVRPQTLLGRIPNLRRVPFNVSVPVQTAGAVSNWVGQGGVKKVSKASFALVTVTVSKAATIVVTTSELLKLAPGADTLLRADLAASIAQFLDQQFVDPTAAPVVNISPGSITNGLTAIPSTDDPLTDLHALRSAYWATNVNPPVLLLSPANLDALRMALARSDVSESMTIIASTALGDLVVMLDPTAVLVADDSELEMNTTRQGTVQLDDAPTDPPGAAAVMTSLWQHNLVGLRAERFINWKRGRDAAVHYVSGASYAPTAPGV